MMLQMKIDRDICKEREMNGFKSGFVTIIGKTNVGKSTLINSLVNEKIAAVANKSQTTRTAIKAIVNRQNSQIIFIDTPGVHKPKTKLGKTMLDTAYKMVTEVDLIVYMVDAQASQISTGDNIILQKLKEINKPVILVLNKIDLTKKENILQLIELYRKEYDFKEIIPISAIQDTTVLLDEIEKYLPEGPAYYDKEQYTDQTLRQLVEEIIREKALYLLNDEVPHGIYVEVEKMQTKKTMENEKYYNIEATIYCLRDGHKGIIIGKGGQMLKKIGSSARYELEKMLDVKVNLKLWVKVKENWLNNDSIVNKFKLQN